MICQDCKKEIKRPLELYDGKLACPHCTKVLSYASRVLEITEVNQELYELSQVCFLRALKSTEASKYEKNIAQAVNLCRLSAATNNPFAIMRLAYFYDKDYVELDQTEEFRCRIAYEYYASILASSLDSIKISALQYVNFDFNDLREKTEKLFCELLKTMPQNLKKNPKYDLQANITAFNLNYKIDNDAVYQTRVSSKTIIEQIKGVISSCLSKEKAPLAILHKNITFEQFNSLFTLVAIKKIIKSGVSIYYTVPGENSKFINLGNEKKIDEELSKLKRDGVDVIHLFVINSKGNHSYFKKSQIEKWKDDLIRKRFSKVSSMITESLNDNYVFYDDDIYFYNRGNIDKGFASLVSNLDND